MESKIATTLAAGLDVPGLRCDDLETLANRHIAQAASAPDALTVRGTRISFLETSIGIVTLAILRYRNQAGSSSGDNWAGYMSVLDCALRNIVREDAHSSTADDDGCEVLYGRAGLLYAFLLLQNALRQGFFNDLPPDFARQLNHLVTMDKLRLITDSIIVRGRRGSRWLREELETAMKTEQTAPPLMWSWHQKRYLGAAHGVGGLKVHLEEIFIRVSSSRHFTNAP